jgi:hypothetical protein
VPGVFVTTEPQLPPDWVRRYASDPGGVYSFCKYKGIVSHAELALDLAMTFFPAGSKPSLLVERDPDDSGVWLVIDVRVAADVDKALNCYNKWVDDWVIRTGPDAREHIRLTFDLD